MSLVEFGRTSIRDAHLHGWSDPEIANSNDALAIRVSVNSRIIGELRTSFRGRGPGFPLGAAYLALDSRLMDNLGAALPYGDFFAGANELLGSSGMALRVFASQFWMDSHLESAGMRWCDAGEPGHDRVYEFHSGSSLNDRMQAGVGSAPKAGRPRVHLATGSNVKWSQYEYLFRSHGIDLEWSNLAKNVPEPQVEGTGDGPEQILVEAPLKQLARFARLSNSYPILLEDTMIFIEHFNRRFSEQPLLPGPDTKRWWAALGAEGVLEQMRGSKKRRAKYVAQLGVLDRDGIYRVFRSEVEGSIAQSVRVEQDAIDRIPYSNPDAFHQVFIPLGSEKTYAEMMPGEFRRFDYRSACVDKAVPVLLDIAGHPSYVQLPFDLDQR